MEGFCAHARSTTLPCMEGVSASALPYVRCMASRASSENIPSQQPVSWTCACAVQCKEHTAWTRTQNVPSGEG
eukprot:359170-Chlamydomonas_euryale.AAC.8